MQLQEGDVLARRYRLGQRIGSGGMSVIWRAWDEALQRTVAVKVLDGPLGTDHAHREMIQREARAAARIEHPHAIQVYDYGETVTPRGRIAAYVVMQLLDGTSLADRLASGPLPWPEAVSVAARVAEVLAAAHRRNVVHRDVTPENVMLTTDGVKLLDFGIATDFGQREETITFGTPPYVAPERLAGAQATGAADVYALGVLLYESLTGGPPFGATTWDEVERLDRRVPPLDVAGLPPEVAALCRRCLAADPARRPSADDVAAALTAATARPVRGRRYLLAAAAAVGAIAVAVVFALLYTGHDASTPPPPVAEHSIGPAPSPVGSPSSQPPSSGPPSSAPSAPPPPSSARATPAAPLDPDQAAAAVFDVLNRRGATGEIRSDVVNDVRNQMGDLVAHPNNPQPRIDSLRAQLRERERAQSITAGARVELDKAIVAFGDAITSG
jgi:eukaryotic-like serine/threonine-protein kinase